MTCPDLHSMLERVATSMKGTLDSLTLPNNPVIVFDVDNTLIDNYGKPLLPIIDIYHYARKKGIHIVIITARVGTPENIEYTRHQLRSYGIDNYLYMYFRHPQKGSDATAQTKFKLLSRQNIHERGHTVIMSVGDMPWDIGEYGGYGFQVPSCNHYIHGLNPVYFAK